MQTYNIDKSESIDLSSVEFPPFEISPNLPLGTNREITQPPPEDIEKDSLFYRVLKWARQDVYRELIPTKAARFCHRGIAPIVGPDGLTVPRKYVDVLKSKNDRFSYSGLFTCGSVWLCPVCASKISERRRIELRAALEVAEGKSLTVLHQTLTAPHHLGESLTDLLEKMANARRLMLNRKPWKRLAVALGVVGNIRALEVTHSWLNGWHVHFHVLIFFMAPLSHLEKERSISNLNDMIFPMWESACLSAGLEAPSKEHGTNLTDGATDYVGKWGSEHEMTKAHIKKGREGNLSPFDFLDEYRGGDDRYKGLFLEYSKAFKGKKQLVWSRGLREMLRLEPEQTDQEITDQGDPDAELFGQIPRKVWSVIVRQEKRAEVLEVCRQGKQAFIDYLNEIKEPPWKN